MSRFPTLPAAGRRLGWTVALCAVLVSAGCSRPAAPAAAPPPDPRWAAPPLPWAPKPADKPAGPVQEPVWSVSELKPSPAGPGLILYDPVHSGSPPDLVALADSAVLWLELAILGRGELGQTPSPFTIGRGIQDAGHRDARLAPAEAAVAARNAGGTHAVACTVSGSLERCVLQFQVVRAADGAVQGEPIGVDGAAAQVVQGLPTVARQILERLAVNLPDFKTQVELSPDDLGFLGLVHSTTSKQLSLAQFSRLRELAARSPVAGALYVLKTSERSEAELRVREVAEALLKQAPDNVRLYPILASQLKGIVRTATADPLGDLRTRFPGNLQLLEAALLEEKADRLVERRQVLAACRRRDRNRSVRR